MTKSTFRVLFLTQKGKPRPDGRVPVVARITFNGQMAHFTTSVDVDPDTWLPKDGRTVGITKTDKEANSSLEDYRVLIRQKYNDLLMVGEIITAARIKQAVTSLDEKSYSLLEICDRFIEDYVKLVATLSVTQCTYQRYDYISKPPSSTKRRNRLSILIGILRGGKAIPSCCSKYAFAF